MCQTNNNQTTLCFRKLVDQHCEKTGASRAAIVRTANVTRSSFYEWLDGKPIPAAHTQTLADTLNTTKTIIEATAAVPACPAPVTTKPEISAYGQALKKAAKAKNMSLDKLAKAAYIGRSSLFAAVNGSHQPSPEQMLAVAKQLDLDVVELAKLTDEPVECGADEERLRLGLSRYAYAAKCKVNADFLYGKKETQRPDLAFKTVQASGGDIEEAAAAAKAARTSIARCPLGEVIEAGLDRLGITANELAASLNVTRQALEQWVGGTSNPRAESVEKLSKKLGVEKALIENAVASGVAPHLNVGQRLKEARLAKNLRQVDVAKTLGVSDPIISCLENGTRRLTEPMAKKLEETYGWDLLAETETAVSKAS